ncbi:hypothetical protein [Leucobacter aridicollis]|uniref:hypothetical protein n=1 Tax=Leucobacter aridicollis TaxID=283878 RepID=UPI0037CABA3D
MNTRKKNPFSARSAISRKQRVRAWWAGNNGEILSFLKRVGVIGFTFIGLIVIGFVWADAWSAAGGNPEVESALIWAGFLITALALLIAQVIVKLILGVPKLGVPMTRAQLLDTASGDLHREARHAALHIVVGWKLGFVITSSDIRNASCLYSWSFNATEVSSADARFASMALHLAGLLEGEPITLVQSRDSNHALSVATEIVASNERPADFVGDLSVSVLIAAAASAARAIQTEYAELVSQIASIHARTHVLDERLIAELLTPFLADSTLTR